MAPLWWLLIGTDPWKNLWVASQKGNLSPSGSVLSQARPGGLLRKGKGFLTASLGVPNALRSWPPLVPALKYPASLGLWEWLIEKTAHEKQKALLVFRCDKELGFGLAWMSLALDTTVGEVFPHNAILLALKTSLNILEMRIKVRGVPMCPWRQTKLPPPPAAPPPPTPLPQRVSCSVIKGSYV